MTTSERSYPSRVALKFQGKSGQVALDQLRTVDKLRLVKRLGKITPKVEERISQTLVEMFTL
jgi:mRNA interferase MazF